MAEGASSKSERLVNLTMALLATRRYLTKSEIFSSVEGYSGSPETMERMFERDKNDLRELGLQIEVGSDDPLFEDEAGYKINPSEYSLDLGKIDGIDLALLSLAAGKWQNSLFSKSGQSAIRKFESLGHAMDTQILDLPLYSAEFPVENFELLWHAVEKRQVVHFTYSAIVESKRSVQPYGLALHKGFWYLVGLDSQKLAIRNFKLSRISSEISVDPKIGSFVIPDNFTSSDHLGSENDAPEIINVEVHIRLGQAQEIRAMADVTNLDGEWELAKFSLTSKQELFELLGRSLTSVILIEPHEFREEFIQRIRMKISGDK